MHPQLVLYSNFINEIPGINTDRGSKVIENITEATTPENFDSLVEGDPEYHFKHYWSMSCPFGTALHKSVFVGNFQLAIFLIEKFGKDFINVTDRFNKTVIFTAIQSNSPQSLSFLKHLVNYGANVNYPHLMIAGNTSKSKIKLLLKYGAQQGCRFLKIGNKILNNKIKVPADFNVNKALFDKADRPSEVLEKAKSEINAEKFQFFLGLKDKDSLVSAIPKEIVENILSNIVYPSIRKKAEEMLVNAINEINKL
ncbi:MAG: hypothetical protein H0U49_10105 [Parachlamydiaceae bacterium]|nr:hypothetical protein [Parachlamydiaceae bacterium]